MEPVNIDFMLGGNVAQEGPKIEKSIDDITAASKKAVDAATLTGMKEKMKASIAEQKQLIKEITLDIKNLQDQLSKDPKNKTIAGDLAGAKSALKEEQASLVGMQRQRLELNSQEVSSQGGAIASLGKWAIGLASVTAALKIGKEIIASTEGTAHSFEQGVAAASSATNYFFKSIASGDWSNFWQGLDKAIQGATDYVDAMEKVQNMRNQDKLTTPVVDKQIADAYIEITKKVGKTGKQQLADIDNYLGLIKTKYLPLIETSKANLDALLNKASSSTGGKITAPDIQNFLEQYRSLEKMLKSGEEYNSLLKDSKALQKGMMSDPASSQVLLPKYDETIKELNALGEAGKNAGKKVNEISLIPMDLRGEIADAGKEYKGLIATMEGEGKRMYMRRGTTEVQIAADAKEAAKKAQDDAKKALDEKNKRIKEGLDYDTEIGRKRIANKYEIEQQLLNAEADGAEKQRKQADLDYRKRIDDLGIQKAEFIKKQNEKSGGIDKKTGKPTATFSAVLPAEDQKQFDDMEAAALVVKNAKLAEITKKGLDDLKKLYVQYGDERTKIETEYNDRIAKLVEAGCLYQNTEFLAQAANLKQEEAEKISAVSERLIKETDLYKLASGKQLLISKELTQQLIAESKKQIAAEVALHKLTPEDASRLLAKLDKADLTVQKTDNPFADLIDGLEKYKKARTEQSNTNKETDLVNFALMEDAANKAQKATMEAAAGALQGIGTILSQVAGELTGLTDAEKETVDEVVNMINGAATLAQGIATGNPVAIIQGSLELLINLYKLLDFESQKLDKRINDSKTAVEALTIAYDKLGEAIKKAYSADKAKLIEDQTAILKKTRDEKQTQLDAENQKSIDANKKINNGVIGWAEWLFSPKTDKTVVAGLTKDIADLNIQLAATQDSIIEAMTGTSVMSAIDEFANAYADVFTSSEDAAAKSIDVVSNLFKTSLVEKLKNDLKPGVTELMTMVSDAMADGILTADEKAAIMLKKKEVDATAAKDKQAFDDLGLNTSTAAKGIIGDARNMTEDTGSAVVGQITAMRLNVAEIVSGYKNSAAMMAQQIAIQQRIADNTEFCRKLERMDATMEYWRVNGMKVI